MKAFLFLGVGDAMLKLSESLPAATKLAAKEPTRYRAGGGGWVKVTFGEEAPPLALLESWIGESYRLFAAKESGNGRAKPKKEAAKKKRASR